mgnify:CR=1 FL=1
MLPSPESTERLAELRTFRAAKREQRILLDTWFFQMLEMCRGDRIVRRGVCPCGKHAGLVVQIRNEEGEYVDKATICPITYYTTKWSERLRKSPEEAQRFLRENPYSAFVEKYALQTKQPVAT